jgi:PD-(D/E)XK nuclease superfamily
MASFLVRTRGCARCWGSRCRPRHCGSSCATPSGSVWRYALGWRQPEEADEPLTLDPLARGNLVHEALQWAVEMLEDSGWLARAKPATTARAIEDAIAAIAENWESEQPVPPAVIGRNALETAREVSTSALMHPLDKMPGQKNWTEVPFGAPDETGRHDLPWDPARPVEIPGTGILIHGHIDRLDVAGDGARAW